MTEPGYLIASLDDVPVVPDGPGPADWRALRHHFGLGAFGINVWTATEDGQVLIDEHDEVDTSGAGGHEEIYLVLNGSATFKIAGEAVRAPARTLVAVRDPSLWRSAVAEEAGTTVLAIGSPLGEPFEVSEWESRRLGDR